MQVFDQNRRTAIAAGLAVLFGLALPAMAHDGPHQAGGTKPAKAGELGASAAIDAQGRLWIVSKETAGADQYVAVQTSIDMGQTWSAPRRVQQQPEAVSAEGENRPKIAFGSKGEIYITYTKPLAKPYTGDIRFVRSTDGGKTFAPPVTVHANRDLITHRFESLIVDREGRLYVAWIDKRDLEAAAARKKKYAGAALYYAVSEDGGASFKGDYKIADHSCECCRIALALNPQGRPVALWRHVFEPNVRDHALIELTPDGKLAPLTSMKRASFDDWRVDACPHQGPALAIAADGTRHQAWFNVKDGEGGVFYAATDASGELGKPIRLGSAQAAHADVAVTGKNVLLAWKQFDGKSTAILGKLSNDGGHTWQDRELARTQGASDQPRLLNTPSGFMLVWHTQHEGMRTVLLKGRQ
ncbi:exo-alpha-sialidase [Noviherbaspirillum cavernae]|uniref:Exo-alpha-sialidase n=1 Tax=Noviherbaspirillum cavernae TaxID=2320862 RepID=A0A418WYY9_9BURK|nr:sialidase family protein [Noviherbaspirillum cavernae]RJG05450.1 exo-alpha-sialidase [Noviherbaspirillum cavernae]